MSKRRTLNPQDKPPPPRRQRLSLLEKDKPGVIRKKPAIQSADTGCEVSEEEDPFETPPAAAHEECGMVLEEPLEEPLYNPISQRLRYATRSVTRGLYLVNEEADDDCRSDIANKVSVQSLSSCCSDNSDAEEGSADNTGENTADNDIHNSEYDESGSFLGLLEVSLRKDLPVSMQIKRKKEEKEALGDKKLIVLCVRH